MVSSEKLALPPSVSWRKDLLVLLIFFGVWTFAVLGHRPLANPDEGRYAEIPREMVASGDWLTPHLNAVPYFEKPPLVYWCVAACLVLFGPAEGSVRLTPAVFALIGVLLTYAAGRRMYGRDAGLAAAIVLGSGLLYFGLSRLLILDMVVSVLMSGALFCFILGVREPVGARRRWLFYGLYASAALATLSKGLIGFLVPGAVMFLWLLVFNQWRRLRPLYLPSGVTLFLVIAAPWHVLVAERNPGWAQFYFVHEHWTRFTTTVHRRYEPWWFFIPIVLLGLFPWVGFLWAALRDGLRGGWSRRRENVDFWFFVTWAVFVLLFFSKSQSKLIPYILPVFPPLAIVLGVWLAKAWHEDLVTRLRLGLRVFAFLCGLLAVALLVVAFKPGVLSEPEQADSVRPYAIAMAAILLVGGLLAPWFARIRGGRAALKAVFVTTLAFLFGLALAVPDIRSTKNLALIARERMRPEDRVYHYHAFFHDFVYYTQRPVGLVSYEDELELQFLDPAERAARFIDGAEFRRQWSGTGRVWFVARKHQAKSLLEDPAFRYHLIAESPTHYLCSNQP